MLPNSTTARLSLWKVNLSCLMSTLLLGDGQTRARLAKDEQMMLLFMAILRFNTFAAQQFLYVRLRGSPWNLQKCD